MKLTAKEKKALAEIEDALIWEATKPHTQEEIAKRLGISQQHVAKLESKALLKLRALVNSDWEDGVREPIVYRFGVKHE